MDPGGHVIGTQTPFLSTLQSIKYLNMNRLCFLPSVFYWPGYNLLQSIHLP